MSSAKGVRLGHLVACRAAKETQAGAAGRRLSPRWRQRERRSARSTPIIRYEIELHEKIIGDEKGKSTMITHPLSRYVSPSNVATGSK